MSDDLLLVKTAQGVVRGKYDVDSVGEKYFKFHSIPYAKPPIGELRFRVIMSFTYYTAMHV